MFHKSAWQWYEAILWSGMVDPPSGNSYQVSSLFHFISFIKDDVNNWSLTRHLSEIRIRHVPNSLRRDDVKGCQKLLHPLPRFGSFYYVIYSNNFSHRQKLLFIHQKKNRKNRYIVGSFLPTDIENKLNFIRKHKTEDRIYTRDKITINLFFIGHLLFSFNIFQHIFCFNLQLAILYFIYFFVHFLSYEIVS